MSQSKRSQQPIQSYDLSDSIRNAVLDPLTTRATSAGERGALEEGVWGRNLVKVSPPLAQPPKTLPLNRRPAIKPASMSGEQGYARSAPS